jgi:hypothetical protein
MKPVALDAWKEAVKAKSQLVYRISQTPDGKELMDMLKQTFSDGSIFNENPTIMARNVGQRDVVQYLIELSENMNNE